MGVVGVGTMGKRHAENIRRLIPEAQLIAVADADLARARQVAAELEIEHSYNTVEALVERKDIQAVAIVTPAKFHGAAIRACAHARKDIFCEKPLTLTVDEADEVLSLTAKAGVRLQPGHVRRYDPSHVRAKKRIEAGEIGDPVLTAQGWEVLQLLEKESRPLSEEHLDRIKAKAMDEWLRDARDGPAVRRELNRERREWVMNQAGGNSPFARTSAGRGS